MHTALAHKCLLSIISFEYGYESKKHKHLFCSKRMTLNVFYFLCRLKLLRIDIIRAPFRGALMSEFSEIRSFIPCIREMNRRGLGIILMRIRTLRLAGLIRSVLNAHGNGGDGSLMPLRMLGRILRIKSSTFESASFKERSIFHTWMVFVALCAFASSCIEPFDPDREQPFIVKSPRSLEGLACVEHHAFEVGAVGENEAVPKNCSKRH